MSNESTTPELVERTRAYYQALSSRDLDATVRERTKKRRFYS